MGDANWSDEFFRYYDPNVGEVLKFHGRRRGSPVTNTRRLFARVALVDRIVADERWGLFEIWGAETGLIAAALEARQVLYGQAPQAPSPDLAKATGERLGQQVEKNVDQVVILARGFITDTLRWPPRPWLVSDLGTRLFGFIAASAMGPLEVRYGIEPRHPAPRVYVAEFRTREGEDARAALQRIKAHKRDVELAERVIAATAKARPGRKAPRMVAQEKIRRNVDWLYRRHTGLATISDLTREDFSRRRGLWSGDDSKVIRGGIAAAQKDLGMPSENSRR